MVCRGSESRVSILQDMAALMQHTALGGGTQQCVAVCQCPSTFSSLGLEAFAGLSVMEFPAMITCTMLEQSLWSCGGRWCMLLLEVTWCAVLTHSWPTQLACDVVHQQPHTELVTPRGAEIQPGHQQHVPAHRNEDNYRGLCG